MTDPAPTLQKIDTAAAAAVNAEAPKAVAWFVHPVPLWTIGVAFLAGTLLDALRTLA